MSLHCPDGLPKRKFPSNFFLSLALGNGSTGPVSLKHRQERLSNMTPVIEKPSQTNTGSSAAGPSSSNQEAPISSASNAPVQQLNLNVDYAKSDDTASPVRRTPKKRPPVCPSSGVESILSHRRLGSQSMPFPLSSTPPSFARGIRALPRSAQPAQLS